MITNKFIHFKHKETFEKEISNIPYDAIVFILDEQLIYTHGHFYSDFKKLIEQLTKNQQCVTYLELVSLRNLSKLIPGMLYRITDYDTTTTQADTRSVHKQFDVIVEAISNNQLSEIAKASKHEGDTYFDSCDLSAWELKYSLDNDINRFEWADAAFGKGVIYWMKDEYNNECPYDFKNIQFKRYKITATTTSCTYIIGKYMSYGTSMTGFYVNSSDFIWCYTFSSNSAGGEQVDYSLDLTHGVYSNVIKEYVKSKRLQLNKIVFFGDNCFSNTFGNDCRSNTFGNNCSHNTFDNNCFSNAFGDDFRFNTSKGYCSSNVFGYNCVYNTFGSYFRSNTFGSYCSFSTFGHEYSYNTSGNNCQFNTFGINCVDNVFGYTSDLTSTDPSKTPQSYFSNIKFEDGISHVNLTSKNHEVTSYFKKIQNITIHKGIRDNSISSVSNPRVEIQVEDYNANYEIEYGRSESGEIVKWCTPDLTLHDVRGIEIQISNFNNIDILNNNDIYNLIKELINNKSITFTSLDNIKFIDGETVVKVINPYYDYNDYGIWDRTNLNNTSVPWREIPQKISLDEYLNSIENDVTTVKDTVKYQSDDIQDLLEYRRTLWDQIENYPLVGAILITIDTNEINNERIFIKIKNYCSTNGQINADKIIQFIYNEEVVYAVRLARDCIYNGKEDSFNGPWNNTRFSTISELYLPLWVEINTIKLKEYIELNSEKLNSTIEKLDETSANLTRVANSIISVQEELGEAIWDLNTQTNQWDQPNVIQLVIPGGDDGADLTDDRIFDQIKSYRITSSFDTQTVFQFTWNDMVIGTVQVQHPSSDTVWDSSIFADVPSSKQPLWLTITDQLTLKEFLTGLENNFNQHVTDFETIAENVQALDEQIYGTDGEPGVLGEPIVGLKDRITTIEDMNLPNIVENVEGLVPIIQDILERLDVIEDSIPFEVLTIPMEVTYEDDSTEVFDVMIKRHV